MKRKLYQNHKRNEALLGQSFTNFIIIIIIIIIERDIGA